MSQLLGYHSRDNDVVSLCGNEVLSKLSINLLIKIYIINYKEFLLNLH